MNAFQLIFFFSCLASTHLADVEGIEEDSVEEVLEAEKHHLRNETISEAK